VGKGWAVKTELNVSLTVPDKATESKSEQVISTEFHGYPFHLLEQLVFGPLGRQFFLL